MSTPPVPFAQLKEAADALAQHGSQIKAAAALGLSRGALQQRLSKYAQNVERRRALQGKVGCPPIPAAAVPPPGFIVHSNNSVFDAEGNLVRQSIGTKRDAGDIYSVPDGHVVRGESALVDADGRISARWIKTSAVAENTVGLVEGLQAAFAAYKGAAPLIAAPAECDEDLLTVYPIPDLHYGALAWGKETGADYDMEIATEMAIASLRTLVAQSRPSKHAVVLGLGDYFHSDDQRNVTPGSGHQLDVDGRWAKVFAGGAKLATALVEIVAQKHSQVEIKFLVGNHDLNSAMCLTVALDLFYSNNPRVTVNTDPGIAWYRRFGKCLLGATHGHAAKMDKLPMMMAVDRAEDWGATQHRSFLTGHIHTETTREIGGVRVESLQAMAARDAWNAASGYRSGRSMSALTFHVEDGETGRHRVNIGHRT